MGDMCGSKPPSAKTPRLSAQPVSSEQGSDQVLSHVDDAVSPTRLWCKRCARDLLELCERKGAAKAILAAEAST